MFKYWKKAVTVLMVALVLGVTLGGPSLAAKGGKGGGEPRVICYGKPGAVATIDENGDSSLTVVEGKDIGYAASWSPDGNWLGGYQSDLGGDQSVMMIRPDGSDEQIVVTYSEVDAFNVASGRKSKPSGGIADVTWGPDGFMIFQADVVYTIEPHPDAIDQEPYDVWAARLFMVNTITGDISRVTDEPGGYLDRFPHYSPALGKVVFVSYRVNNRAELFSINPDGTGLQQLTNLQGRRIWGAAWNNAGTQLAVSVETPGGVGSNSDIWLYDVDLSGDIPATFAFALATDPDKTEIAASWAPGDTRLVFQRSWRPSSRTTRYQIVKVDLAESTETILVDSKNSTAHTPDWNPVPPAP